MAIDPNILLQYRGPDIGNALLRGVQTAESLQSMKLRGEQAQQKKLMDDQKFQQAEREAALFKAGTAASKIKPLIQAKDIEGIKNILSTSGLPEDEVERYSLYAEAGRWDQLSNVADETIELARSGKVFERDYASSAGGYVSSSKQDFAMLRELESAVRNAPAGSEQQMIAQKDLENFQKLVISPKYYSQGGGLYGEYNPLGRTATQLPVTGTSGGTKVNGTGGPFPPSPNVPPTGASVDLGASIDEGAGGGSTTTPEKIPSPEKTISPEEVIRDREMKLTSAIKTGELDAKQIAELQTQVNSTRSKMKGLAARYKNTNLGGYNLGELLRNAPQTGIGGMIATAGTYFVNGLEEARSRAKIETLFQELVKLQPFPPGAQSEAEMIARQRVVGDILGNGSLTPQDKLEMISGYFDGLNAEAQEQWLILNETRERQGMSKVPTPYDQGEVFGITPEGNIGNIGTGGGTAAPTNAPADVEPGQFKVRRIQ